MLSEAAGAFVHVDLKANLLSDWQEVNGRDILPVSFGVFSSRLCVGRLGGGYVEEGQPNILPHRQDDVEHRLPSWPSVALFSLAVVAVFFVCRLRPVVGQAPLSLVCRGVVCSRALLLSLI